MNTIEENFVSKVLTEDIVEAIAYAEDESDYIKICNMVRKEMLNDILKFVDEAQEEDPGQWQGYGISYKLPSPESFKQKLKERFETK